MAESTFNSVQLQEFITRWQEGDTDAVNDLLRATKVRMERLARRMTRSFPNVRVQADTNDVLQNSLLRLLRTLEKIRPRTTRDFFNLAAVHIRRELLDLARKCRNRTWLPFEVPDDSDRPNAIAEPAAEPVSTTDDFELWVRFHQAVDQLPVEEREVVGLVFYHGWTQVRIAELFNVDERTIRRRWSSACEHLRRLIGNDLTADD